MKTNFLFWKSVHTEIRTQALIPHDVRLAHWATGSTWEFAQHFDVTIVCTRHAISWIQNLNNHKTRAFMCGVPQISETKSRTAICKSLQKKSSSYDPPSAYSTPLTRITFIYRAVYLYVDGPQCIHVCLWHHTHRYIKILFNVYIKQLKSPAWTAWTTKNL